MNPDFLAKHSCKYNISTSVIYIEFPFYVLAKLIRDGLLSTDVVNAIKADAAQRLTANKYWQPRSKFCCKPRSCKFSLIVSKNIDK